MGDPHSTLSWVQSLHNTRGASGSDAGTHHRIRHDHVDTNGSISLRHAGRMHHIGIGRPHARTPVILLIADLDIRVIHRTTGELLRHLTLDPTRNYQPQPKRPKA